MDRHTSQGCSAALKRLDDGGTLTNDELRQINACETCAQDVKVGQLLAFNGSAPLGGANEFADQQLIRSLVEEATSPTTAVKESTPRRWVRPLLLAALALFAVGATFWLWTASDQRTLVEDSPAAKVSEGTLVFASGAGSARVGEEIGEGTHLSRTDGEMAGVLTPAVTFWLGGPETDMSVVSLDEDQIVLRLARGRLFIHVDPSLAHPDVAVETPDGTVSVTGTVFEVTVFEQVRADSEVAVFRGEVEVSAVSGAKANVRRGIIGEIGSGRTRSMTELEMDRGIERLNHLRTVSALAQSADWEDKPRCDSGPPNDVDCLGSLLTLQTTPPGAQIRMDGVVLGTAPLVALLPGRATLLEVQLDGFATVREEILLNEGESTERSLLLTRVSSGPSALRVAPMVRATHIQLHSLVRQSLRLALVERELAEERPKPDTRESVQTQTPKEMLRRAQTHRRNKEWKRAAGTFDALIDTHPKSAEARTAYVSLGGLQLDKLKKPRRALESFEHYLLLSPRGTLAEEARFGRIRALRALRRTSAVGDAIDEFLEFYPESMLADEVRGWRGR